MEEVTLKAIAIADLKDLMLQGWRFLRIEWSFQLSYQRDVPLSDGKETALMPYSEAQDFYLRSKRGNEEHFIAISPSKWREWVKHKELMDRARRRLEEEIRFIKKSQQHREGVGDQWWLTGSASHDTHGNYRGGGGGGGGYSGGIH